MQHNALVNQDETGLLKSCRHHTILTMEQLYTLPFFSYTVTVIYAYKFNPCRNTFYP
jgi:hypothetical protein